ncbi:MAG: type II toxin-antitoxin system RelE/ParE family toxin [Acidobacteriota bacterium]|nr:type II toxin-antitoxin system RelE/ParE family toxin [Acidobacteriota bacterium]
MNRTAAPNAIGQEFSAMIAILVRSPNIGRLATNVKRRNVRRVGLRRVGYEIYYRVIGSPPVLEVMAFWHSRRGTGPPI